MENEGLEVALRWVAAGLVLPALWAAVKARTFLGRRERQETYERRYNRMRLGGIDHERAHRIASREAGLPVDRVL